MASLADKAILSGADNRPLMLEKDMYDSWKSRMELYMLNRPHDRMILESVEQGPLIWPSVEVEGVTRLKKYSELSAAEAIQADCDVKATNIILQGLPPEVNTKFLNTLPSEWSKFVTDVKLVRDLHTTNVDQLHAYLGQHEYHANEVRLMNEHTSHPLALISQHQLNRTPYPHHQPLYQQSQFQPQATSYQSSPYGPTYPDSYVNTKLAKQSLLGKQPSFSRPKLYVVTPLPKSKAIHKVGESNALLNQVTLNSIPSSQESNIVKNDNKFLGTVCFGNDHVAAILGYGDLQWENILITRVYFVEGLGHNLFLVGSKDKAPEVIKTFLKKIRVLLQASVILVRIDNGTEFKNQVLQEYFNSVGISHQASSVRTHQPNGVVERRNCTLVEAARTINPDISFLHVLWAISCPKNDREDIEKLGEKGLDLTYALSTITSQQPTERELDLWFKAMYDDYIGVQPSATTRTILAAQATQVLQTPIASTTIPDTAPTPTNSSSQAINIPNTSPDVDELETQQHVQ
nr:ribonuclease H-like domain-containing protein [Tanacetum cinerariifolium]